jgi:hypothetical protein
MICIFKNEKSKLLIRMSEKKIEINAVNVAKLVIVPLPFIEWVLERYHEYTAKSEGGDATGALNYISEHPSLTQSVMKGVSGKRLESTIAAILAARAVLAFNAGVVLVPPLMGGGGQKKQKKILNPKTRRYVLRTGRIGSKLCKNKK